VRKNKKLTDATDLSQKIKSVSFSVICEKKIKSSQMSQIFTENKICVLQCNLREKNKKLTDATDFHRK
jgi:hypothetical protein